MCWFSLELYIAVPVGIALYPRIGSIKLEDLETEFSDKQIKSANGELVGKFNFNKGL